MDDTATRIRAGNKEIQKICDRIEDYRKKVGELDERIIGLKMEIRKREDDTRAFIEEQGVDPAWYRPEWMGEAVGDEVKAIRYSCN